MIFLDTSEALARIGGALPPGHRLLSLALELAAMAGSGGEAETTRRLFPLKETASGWPGEVGALGDPEGSPGKRAAAYLLWLGPAGAAKDHQVDVSVAVSSKPTPVFRQLVLNPPPGRYRIEYWDPSDCHLAGVEIGTSAPLVLGSPGDGPFIVSIQRLV